MELTSIINHILDPKILSILARIIVSDVYKVLQPDDKVYFRETREKMLNKKIEDIDLESEKYIPILLILLILLISINFHKFPINSIHNCENTAQRPDDQI